MVAHAPDEGAVRRLSEYTYSVGGWTMFPDPFFLPNPITFPLRLRQANDDGNYWGVGTVFASEPGVIPSKTEFNPSSKDVPRSARPTCTAVCFS